MSRKPDPRPERTRQALFNALLELIQEKRWEQIRVQDILDRTGIGRTTFYSHFENKFDLLTAEIPVLSVTFKDGSSEPDFLPLFQHVPEMQPVMKPLMSQPLLAEIMATFQARLSTSWEEHFRNLGIDGTLRTVTADFLAGGFMAVAKQWLIDGCKRDAAEVHADFLVLSRSAIAASQR